MSTTLITAPVDAAPCFAHAQHEARHCVAAWVFDESQVESVSIGAHAGVEQAGVARIRGPVGLADLVARLVGWMGDPSLPQNAVWPEPWPVRENAPESIGVIVRQLGLSKEQYEGACRIAQELVEEPTFKEAVDLVARALMVAPHIDSEGLEVLRQETGFAKPEEGVAA